MINTKNYYITNKIYKLYLYVNKWSSLYHIIMASQ